MEKRHTERANDNASRIIYEQYTDQEIHFMVEQMKFSVHNIAFEQIVHIIPGHFHGDNSFEIHYITEGEGWLKTKKGTYPLQQGTLFVMGPYQEHAQLSRVENPMTEYCIYLHLDQNPSKVQDSPLTAYFLKTLNWTGEDHQCMREIFQDLFRELKEKRSGYMVNAKSLLSRMVVSIVRNFEDSLEAGVRTSASFPEWKMASFLDRNRDFQVELAFLYEYADITLEKLADRIGLGVRQTQRFLQENYGMNFQNMRTQARMSAADMLLTHTDESITRIAEMVGYSNSEHFAVAFKQYYKTTPRVHRKHNRVSKEALLCHLKDNENL